MNDQELLNLAFSEHDLANIFAIILKEFRRCQIKKETFFISQYSMKDGIPYGSGVCLYSKENAPDILELQKITADHFRRLIEECEKTYSKSLTPNLNTKENKDAFKRVKIESRDDGGCDIKFG